MSVSGEFKVIYENGVLRPETALPIPEHTRLEISIRRIDPSPEDQERAKKLLDRIRREGRIRMDNWRPTREELHERH